MREPPSRAPLRLLSPSVCRVFDDCRLSVSHDVERDGSISRSPIADQRGFLCRKSFGVPRPIVVRGPRERENAAKSAWYAPSPPPHTHPFAALKHHHSYLQRSRQPTYCLGAGVSGRETRANGKRHSRLPGAAVPLPPAPCPRVARAAAPTARTRPRVSEQRRCANPGVSRGVAASHEALACVPRGGHAEAH